MFRYCDDGNGIRTSFDLPDVLSVRSALSSCAESHPVFQSIAELFERNAPVQLTVKQAELLNTWLHEHLSCGIDSICSQARDQH